MINFACLTMKQELYFYDRFDFIYSRPQLERESTLQEQYVTLNTSSLNLKQIIFNSGDQNETFDKNLGPI